MNNIERLDSLRRAFRKPWLRIAAGVFGVLLAGFLWFSWQLFGPNIRQVPPGGYFYLETAISFDSLCIRLDTSHILRRRAAFSRVASLMQADKSQAKAGRYAIRRGMSNVELIRMFRSGRQEAVKLVIPEKRTLAELAGYLATQLMPDSSDFLASFRDTALIDSLGYTTENFPSLFIPNTYEVYWNLSPKKFIDRMVQEHERFWNQQERRKKAQDLGLNEAEVYTLASIVGRESNVASERPRIAGVYLNRLHQGMKLQADPTLVFAIGDFSLRRITEKQILYDSPYNTYLYTGLPPGPISLSPVQAIDAVLQAEKHEYLYFCAKPGLEGSHQFAKTYEQHLEYARAYQNWLNEQGIQ